MNEISLAHIELAARDLRGSRDQVAAIVTALEADIAALQRNAARAIKGAVVKTADRHAHLRGLIDTNRHFFIKPRTLTFHGVTCGLEKGKGKITFADEAQVVAAIEHKLPWLASSLIHIEKTVSKSSLKHVPVADLKRIGCTVEDTGDHIVIRFADSEVDKLVTALLKSAVTQTVEQEAA